MLLGSGQERAEGVALAHRSRRLVFAQYFLNSLRRYPWHWAVWVFVVHPMVPVVLDLPADHLPQGRRADLQVLGVLAGQAVSSSKCDQGRYDLNLVRLTRS